jgi:hypothetical protein
MFGPVCEKPLTIIGISTHLYTLLSHILSHTSFLAP